ncbi:hypothetical protein [Pedobacter sp. GR22-6]|uniref:hypothetical protein n=1 Tax=Pedobacter sp. GR22-6 TaxID=3127957 RepID=UPI00307CF54D
MKDDKNKIVTPVADLTTDSLMEHLGLTFEEAKSLLFQIAKSHGVEVEPILSQKGEELLNKLPKSPSGEKRDYLN